MGRGSSAPGVMKFLNWLQSQNLDFIVFLPYRCYTPNLVKIGPAVLDKKMLTHDARRTQPIAIGHLSYYSGDLKRWEHANSVKQEKNTHRTEPHCGTEVQPGGPCHKLPL
jgi:hypothetical protein